MNKNEKTNEHFLTIFLRINKLNELPKGFGACPTLEVLDLTYNNLTESSFPGNFFYLGMNMFMLGYT